MTKREPPRERSATPGRVRLDRALSKLGAASRAEAGRLIADGRVTVRGRVVNDPAREVVPERDTLAIDGLPVRRGRWRTLLLHKPRGVVTTRRDPEGRRTVFDVLGSESAGLVAVGRLDLATTGLLLLTSDTQLANWLTDPANGVIRRYAVTVRGELSDEAAARMERGIAGLRAARVEVRKRSGRETHLLIDLAEGRNREVRRLVAGIGREVVRLLRVSFGRLELGHLQPGEWRDVTKREIEQAFPGARVAASTRS
jgi:23S rRNA pseudouridine2605 synthase